MPMTINTNIASMNAQRQLGNPGETLNSSLERLSSGLRINKAADDASGLSIADKLRTQANALQQAVNVNIDATQSKNNTLNTTATGLQTAQTLETRQAGLESMKSLLTEATVLDTSSIDNSKGQNSARYDLAKTIQENDYYGITDENVTSLIDSIAQDKTNAGLLVYAPSETDKSTFTTNQTNALDTINSEISALSADSQSNKTATLDALGESQIRDVDYAEESANFQKTSLLAQSGSYALSQANSSQQSVMSLLQ
jgi:flagellin